MFIPSVKTVFFFFRFGVFVVSGTSGVSLKPTLDEMQILALPLCLILKVVACLKYIKHDRKLLVMHQQRKSLQSFQDHKHIHNKCNYLKASQFYLCILFSISLISVLHYDRECVWFQFSSHDSHWGQTQKNCISTLYKLNDGAVTQTSLKPVKLQVNQNKLILSGHTSEKSQGDPQFNLLFTMKLSHQKQITNYSSSDGQTSHMLSNFTFNLNTNTSLKQYCAWKEVIQCW